MFELSTSSVVHFCKIVLLLFYSVCTERICFKRKGKIMCDVPPSSFNRSTNTSAKSSFAFVNTIVV